MKKTLLKYGLLSGGALAVMLCASVPLMNCSTGSAGIWSMITGYTIMILSFLIVFVGVKHYRDTVCGGSITFGRAFGVGLLTMLITCLCYVLMWEVLVATVEKNFAHQYVAAMIKHAQDSGLQGAALDAKVAEAHKFEVMYANPVYRMSMTLLEPLPVAIVMALVTAGILRRKRGDGERVASGSEALAS
jgi:hypothetical protein